MSVNVLISGTLSDFPISALTKSLKIAGMRKRAKDKNITFSLQPIPTIHKQILSFDFEI